MAALMFSASIAGVTARPSETAAQRGNSIVLKRDVPTEFGEWAELKQEAMQVRDPRADELINTIYSQILSRTYANKDGYRIMLSMAYGDDQRGGLQAHRPEVCYPAQGFKVGSKEDRPLPTSFGTIAVRRLTTAMGPREEPVTYWLTVGDHVIQNKWDMRLAEIRLGLTGQIPDGLLFRVSSIDKDAARAFAMQQKFTADMMATVPPNIRRQLSGLPSPGPIDRWRRTSSRGMVH